MIAGIFIGIAIGGCIGAVVIALIVMEAREECAACQAKREELDTKWN